ncbi:hypothetical protein HMPREF0043_01833 [Actinobaculum sp. oral taxon 183 str. F0552]|nr:hypothetical protein HMPREF0043_01833 [Actinobaculum sp. oral taxon 183 str. F0552]
MFIQSMPATDEAERAGPFPPRAAPHRPVSFCHSQFESANHESGTLKP